MKAAQNWTPDTRYVDPLQVRSFNGEIRQYARNYQGIHVPAECLSDEDCDRARQMKASNGL